MEHTLEQFLGLLVGGVYDLTVLSFAQPFVVVVTNILKRLIPANWLSSGTIAFGTQVVVFLAYVVFGKMGGNLSQFESGVTTLGKILEIAAPVLLPGLGAIFAGHTIYEAAKRRNLKVIGYQRNQDDKSILNALQRVRRATAPKKEPVG